VCAIPVDLREPVKTPTSPKGFFFLEKESLVLTQGKQNHNSADSHFASFLQWEFQQF